MQQMKRMTLIGLVLVVSTMAFFASAPFASAESAPKWNALLQTWSYVDGTADPDVWNFRIRRAELSFKTEVSDSLDAGVMVDPAKSLGATDGKILQDLYLQYRFGEFEFQIGQFKIQTTDEGLQPSSDLLIPERSLVGREFGDRREPGGLLGYRHAGWRLVAMISNGHGTNTDDVDVSKDMTARITRELSPELQVGAYGQLANWSAALNDSYGANIRLAKDAMKLRLEVVRGDSGTQFTTGWDAEAAYRLNDWAEPVARWEQLGRGGLDGRVWTVAMDLYPVKDAAKTRVIAAYQNLKNTTGASGTYKLEQASDGSLVTMSFQTVF